MKLISLLVTMLLSTVAVALGTPAGTLISNQAAVQYTVEGDERETLSNIVTTLITGICRVTVLPNGSLESPAYDELVPLGGRLVLPFALTNTGNTDNSYSLSLDYLDEGAALAALRIYLDVNGNGAVDEGEPLVSMLSDVPADETVNLLVEVSAGSSLGIFAFNLIAQCAADSHRDDDNVARVRVVQPGVADFNKTAEPPSGSSINPGASIEYTLAFTVNDLPIEDLSITDVLDDNLADPEALSLLINGVAQDPPVFDPMSRTISTTIARLEPGDTVQLRFQSRVSLELATSTVVRNQASLSFEEEERQSNATEHPVTVICSLNLRPEGSVVSPAYQRSALPGERVVLPYEFVNTGNARLSFSVDHLLLEESSLSPGSISVLWDRNANGEIDPEDLEVQSVSLSPAETAALLLVVDLSSDERSAGDIFVSPLVTCPDGSAPDTRHVSQIFVPLGGFSSLEKTSDPAPGTMLYPDANLSYSISFLNSERDQSDVTVRDPLSEYLSAPLTYSDGTITDPDSGLSAIASARYDSDEHVLIWHFERIPAGMNVVLTIETRVRSDLVDLPELSVVENTAFVQQGSAEPAATNTVIHDLRPIVVVLEKTASPTVAVIGEPLTYSLTILNPPASVPFDSMTLTDQLPVQVRYVAGSSEVIYPDDRSEALEPTQDGQLLSWQLEGIEPGEKMVVRFQVIVLPLALTAQELINTAQVEVADNQGRAVAAAADSVATVLEPGIFRQTAVLMGTAFIDVNNNGLLEQDVDLPVAGLRLYLPDGRSTVTDQYGRYTFQSLVPGLTALKVDTTTLPPRYYQATLNEDKAGLWRIRLQAGVINRQDIPFVPPGLELNVRQQLNVVRGAVSLTKTVDPETLVIRLEVSSSEALKNLHLSESLSLTQLALLASTVEVSMTGHDGQVILGFGDVQAGFTAVLTYKQESGAALQDLLGAPGIEWDLR